VVSYTAAAPTLTKIDHDPCTVKAGSSVNITLTWTNFLGDDTKVWFDPPGGLTLSPVKLTSTTELMFQVAADAAAVAGLRKLQVGSRGGVSSGSALTCTVTK
jgi:hypothetical protein